MSAFFSGTDLNTLRQEGLLRNNFVSLIVNNEGTYDAAITRKYDVEKELEVNTTYKYFDKGDFKINPLVNIDDTIIEYSKLSIIKPIQVFNPFELEERVKELTKVETYLYKDNYFRNYKTNLIQKDLFDDRFNDKFDSKQEFKVRDLLSETIALKLITGSILPEANNTTNLEEISVKVYNKFQALFTNDEMYRNYVDGMMDFILQEFLPEHYGIDENSAYDVVISVIEVLKSIKEQNSFIVLLIDILNDYYE